MKAWNFFLLWEGEIWILVLQVKESRECHRWENLNPGNQFAVKIDWVSAINKLLYSHWDHIDNMNMLCLWYNCTIEVMEAEKVVMP